MPVDAGKESTMGVDYSPDYKSDRAEELRRIRASAEASKHPEYRKIERLEAENEHLRVRIDALERLLVCYRIGKQPSEKLHRDLERTRRALAE